MYVRYTCSAGGIGLKNRLHLNTFLGLHIVCIFVIFLDANEGSSIDLSGYTTEEDLKILVSAICE